MPFRIRRTSTLLAAMVALLVVTSACSLILPEEGTQEPTSTATAAPMPTDTSRPTVPPPTYTPAPSASATPSPVPTSTPAVLGIGGQAKVVLPEGSLNVRADPGTAAELAGRLATGTVVTILDGPARRNDLVWWKVDNGEGTVGWVAEGDEEAPWLEPLLSEPTPTPVVLGPGVRAQVTTQGSARLSLRQEPRAESELITRLIADTEVTVVDGPVQKDGYTWWKVETDEGQTGWVAQGDETTLWLTPIP